MERPRPRLVAVPLSSPRLLLEPLRVDHTEEAAAVFDATAEQLRARFARQVRGRAPDGSEDWLNWMARERESGEIAGTMQATVRPSAGNAEVAWVIAASFRGRGLATEAASTMAAWLRECAVLVLIAHIHPDNQASGRVARKLGLQPTEVVHDGEIRWTT